MINDKVNKEQVGDVKFPKLHGHVKLTLTNALSDNIEKVYEGDNIVTNAVRDIYANNISGGIDYSLMSPLWQTWYGGILCYQQAHELSGGSLDPDNYYPLNSTNNPVTAHAGQTTYTGADDMSRGSPLTDSQSLVITEGSVKQTWEWATTQGNGYIRALSLTHKDTGDAGLGSTSSAFQSFNPFMQVDNLGSFTQSGANAYVNGNCVMTQYDDNHGLCYFIGEDGEFAYNKYNFQSTKISVYIRPLTYKKMGLSDTTLVDNTLMRKFTVTTSVTFYGLPAYYFDYENKRLWLFTNMGNSITSFSKTAINYTVIDCVNETEYSHGTITSDASDLGAICGCGSYDSRPYTRVINILKDGNYFCFPTGTTDTSKIWQGYTYYTGMKKINISNQSDQVAVTYNATQDFPKPYYKCGELLINGNKVINGTTGYTCSTGYFTENGENNPYVAFWSVHSPNSVSSLVYPNSLSRGGSLPRYILVPKMLNTTLYNLDSVAQKLSSQRMTVEYTLSLAT